MVVAVAVVAVIVIVVIVVVVVVVLVVVVLLLLLFLPLLRGAGIVAVVGGDGASVWEGAAPAPAKRYLILACLFGGAGLSCNLCTSGGRRYVCMCDCY